MSQETDKVMDVIAEIVSKLSNELELQRKKTAEIKKEMLSQNEKISDFIDNEKSISSNNQYGLTKTDMEGLLNNHFNNLEELIKEKNISEIDLDVFSDKLNDLTENFKESVINESKIAKKSKRKPFKNLKSFTKEKINTFLKKVNNRIEVLSNKLDSKTKEDNKKDVSLQSEVNASDNVKQNISYKEKIESTLRNDPSLFKETVLITQLNSMRNHINESENQLKELNKISKEDPIEQFKINDMKNKMNLHINQMKGKLNDLLKSHGNENTLDKLNDKSKEHSKETDRAKGIEIEKTTKEVTLER